MFNALLNVYQQTRNHPENANILKAWKSLLDTYHSEMDLILSADDDDLNTTLRYIDAGVTLIRVNLLSGNGSSLAERLETKLKNFSFERIAWGVRIYVMLHLISQLKITFSLTSNLQLIKRKLAKIRIKLVKCIDILLIILSNDTSWDLVSPIVGWILDLWFRLKHMRYVWFVVQSNVWPTRK